VLGHIEHDALYQFRRFHVELEAIEAKGREVAEALAALRHAGMAGEKAKPGLDMSRKIC